MKNLLKFVVVGSFFATVEEFLTVVVLRHDVGAYVFTLVILFPAYLILIWTLSRLLRWLIRNEATEAIAQWLLGGFLGLTLEWTLMGLAPWSNPDANPVLMLLLQLGMFSFWSTVAFAPRLFVNVDELSRRTRRGLLKFYLPYFGVLYGMAWGVKTELKFVVIIGGIVLGYSLLNAFYVGYFLRARKMAGTTKMSPGHSVQ